jgi:hypothetical protein
MLADRSLDAAIDDNHWPLKVRTNGNLNNRNGKQRSEKENHRSHVSPGQVRRAERERLPSADAINSVSREHYKNVF